MRYVIRIFQRDLFSLIYNRRIIFFIVVLPPALLALIGGLRIKSDNVAMRVLFAPEMSEKSRNHIRTMFEQFSALSVSFGEKADTSPLTTINKHRLDLLVIASDSHLTYYTAETDADRIELLRQMIDTIEHARKNEIVEILAQSSEVDWQRPLISFFPTAYGRDYFAVPKLISILVCFMPFLLASVSIIIERDEHTLEPLLVALGTNWSRLMAGKALLPLFVGLFHFLLMVLMSQSLFGLHLKSGFWSILTIQTAAATASVILGLGISCIVSSQLYALIASAVYLLCLILFTGFIFPIDTASPLIGALSHLFPLTFTLDPMTNWNFSGINLRYFSKELAYLTLQIVIYLIFTVQMIKKLRKEL